MYIVMVDRFGSKDGYESYGSFDSYKDAAIVGCTCMHFGYVMIVDADGYNFGFDPFGDGTAS